MFDRSYVMAPLYSCIMNVTARARRQWSGGKKSPKISLVSLVSRPNWSGYEYDARFYVYRMVYNIKSCISYKYSFFFFIINVKYAELRL